MDPKGCVISALPRLRDGEEEQRKRVGPQQPQLALQKLPQLRQVRLLLHAAAAAAGAVSPPSDGRAQPRAALTRLTRRKQAWSAGEEAGQG